MKSRPVLQVSCVQLNWAKSLDRNLDRCLHFIGRAAEEGSRVVLFPEANLTGYYFPDAVRLSPKAVADALTETRRAAAQAGIWAIVGTLKKTSDRFLNLAHVISPDGEIVHEYAKVHMAGRDEQKYCRGGNKLSLFEIDGILCTLVICRDGRHPELYRHPRHGRRADPVPSVLQLGRDRGGHLEARLRAAPSSPPGPTAGSSTASPTPSASRPTASRPPAGSRSSASRSGMPLAEAGYYQEEMITAVLDLSRADRCYALDSLGSPPFLRPYWEGMIRKARARADLKPR